MTQYPEALLARELELCYANISLITDYDVGVEGVPPVTHEEVVRVFTENNERLRDLLFAVIRSCRPSAPASARPPSPAPASRWSEARVSSGMTNRPVLVRVELAFRAPTTRTPRRSATGSARPSRMIVGREAVEEFRIRSMPLDVKPKGTLRPVD